MSQRLKKRRKYLVNRPIQLGFALFLLWMIGIAVFITWLLTYYITWNSIITQFSPAGRLPGVVDESGRLLALVLVPGAAFVLGLGAWVHIYLSNRIAGPLYRIQKVLAAMTRGQDPDKIETRANDYLKDITGEINQLLAARRRERAEMVARLEEILSQAKRIGERNPGVGIQARPVVMLLERVVSREKQKSPADD